MSDLVSDGAHLCTLDDVPDGGGFEAATEVLVLRRGDNAWAYRNVCPHFSIPLNYEPNTFCAYGGELLMCAHHSAMFRLQAGVSVDGTCLGASATTGAIWNAGKKILGE